MTRDDIIRIAQLAGFSPPVSADGYMGLAYDDNLQRFAAAAYAAGKASESEARQAAQLETIAPREELIKRAMQAEKEAYQRGACDEREACASLCNKYAELMLNGRDGCAPITIAMIDQIVKSSNELASLIRLRNKQGTQQ